MRLRTCIGGGLLLAAAACSTAACSATGSADAPELDASDSGDDVTPIVDGGAGDEPAADVAVPPERSLVCGDAGFCETKLPKSDLGVLPSLRGVWSVTPSDVWSVTAEGMILRYDGTRWTTEYHANHGLYAVWATSTDVWAGGEAGLLLHRNAAGEWTRVETDHIAPIRSIYGNDSSDVWFTRDDASIDHFDGSRLENHPVDVAELRITTLFGRAGVGVYAAGHVDGPLSPRQTYDDRAYVFTLSTANIALFNASLPTVPSFAPISGAVLDSADGPRIFLLGYQAYPSSSFLRYGAFGKDDMASFKMVSPAPGASQEEVSRSIPVVVRGPADTWIVRTMGRIYRWDGEDFATMSLAMGYEVSPATIFGAHGTSSEVWIVGDGFALRGPTP